MKVIANGPDGTMICELEHHELEKFMNLYYGKMKRLKIGEEINLGTGYDFANEARDAFTKTRDFVNSNQRMIKTIMRGLTFLPNEPDDDGS